MQLQARKPRDPRRVAWNTFSFTALRRNQPFCHLNLRLLAFRTETINDTFLDVNPPSLWHFVLWQFQQTNTLSVGFHFPCEAFGKRFEDKGDEDWGQEWTWRFKKKGEGKQENQFYISLIKCWTKTFHEFKLTFILRIGEIVCNFRFIFSHCHIYIPLQQCHV